MTRVESVTVGSVLTGRNIDDFKRGNEIGWSPDQIAAEMLAEE
jgi:hypothetical protein